MSDLWKRKMKTYFRMMDVDCDGYLTEKDFDMFGKRFAEFHYADPKRAEQVINGFKGLWKIYTKAATDEEKKKISADKFVELIKRNIADQEAYKKTDDDLIRGFFDMMDLNQDGYLQEDEHRNIFVAAGIKELEWTSVAFEAIDLNHDGKLSFEEFRHGFDEFMLTDDPNNPYNLFLGPLVE